ncbi:sulfurtransferase [Singulisphaera acidiphila]|uniref:Rhodanese-related sulfurtransferase n=1 Tax=Singulisphaera acidiphila (strain ATCC BAA-1392 / DSM 18658 / VKM B-2454 / MOB10) TaxID=886293 RepID=L0DGT3_SINAD|nr:sulfurtransferase [Singulisphaera acidiphila]AGA28065.1 rhodanese-related sulfurtransferase [Singulisphaera acidiphila DSM 18658]
MTSTWLTVPLLVLAPLACWAADSEEKPLAKLVSLAELERRLGEPNLRLLDARPKADYDKGHIPGAVWVDAKAVAAMAVKDPGVLTDRKAWVSWIAPLGIGPKTDVLIYDANRQLDAARLWWLLGYLGVDRTGLLDGSFPLWVAENRPVTTEVPTVAPSPFPVAFRNDRNATRAEVLAAIAAKSALIVDARSKGEYDGIEKRAKRGGHIPAACHLEWSDLVGKDGRFLEESALRAKLAKAGVKASEPVITHCQSGGRASVNVFVLERLGFKARNYYLGWSDWGNAEETPVNAEAASKPNP